MGWWKNFDPDKYIISQILNKYYDVEISDSPEYVFCSLYSKDYLKYDCVRIFYTAENMTPDFTLFDYCIGFDELSFGDRYIRVPNYIMNPKYAKDIELLEKRHLIEANEYDNRQFCGTVVSNGDADSMRDYIFDELSKYKKVASGGRYRNNIGLPEGVSDKLEFQKQYRFALASENTSFSGYTTEKLIEAFAAGGVPIYWGDPNVGKYFNEKAFVNVLAYESLEMAIKEIIKLDQDKELYYSFLSEKVMLDSKHFMEIRNRLENFLLNIFEQPLEQAYRRPTGQWAENVTRVVKKGLMPEERKHQSFSKLWRKNK